MTESLSDTRKRAWATRRDKYGARGHRGAYQCGYLSVWQAMAQQAGVDGLPMHVKSVERDDSGAPVSITFEVSKVRDRP